ncbi:hypothetical protein PF003_g3412 [Phytophthora fragariae]|nr:hypothetical protein PF003_g3412 [Phytophthora fragariae]
MPAVLAAVAFDGRYMMLLLEERADLDKLRQRVPELAVAAGIWSDLGLPASVTARDTRCRCLG